MYGWVELAAIGAGIFVPQDEGTEVFKSHVDAVEVKRLGLGKNAPG
jgi:hypothetical protein